MKRITDYELFYFECPHCGYVHTYTKKSNLVIRVTCTCGESVRLNDDNELDIHYGD